jgi:hypothetical protein
VNTQVKQRQRITKAIRITRREKYFDYFVFKIVDYIAPLRVSAVPCYARGLAVAHSRKLSATVGGSISTRPGVRKITLKTCDFIDIKQRDDLNSARGLDNNFASDRGCDSTRATRLHLRLLQLRRANDGAPDKS